MLFVPVAQVDDDDDYNDGDDVVVAIWWLLKFNIISLKILYEIVLNLGYDRITF